MRQRVWIAALWLLVGGGQGWAQGTRPDLTGMWSDPPPTPVDQFCFITCTDAGIARLNALLDDPANDSRPFRELMNEAARYQNEEYIRPLLTPAASKAFPLDPAARELPPNVQARPIMAR